MHGIVSLLDRPHYSKVQELWRELETDCDLVGIKLTPIPHFSWHVSKEYDAGLLRPVLYRIARRFKPFTVRTTGIGLFTGDRPVLYIALVKDALLLRYQEWVWRRTRRAAILPNPFYTPELWVPHITLAHGDTDWPSLNCAMEKLVLHPFKWEIKVDNIALITQPIDQIGKNDLFFRFTG